MDPKRNVYPLSAILLTPLETKMVSVFAFLVIKFSRPLEKIVSESIARTPRQRELPMAPASVLRAIRPTQESKDAPKELAPIPMLSETRRETVCARVSSSSIMESKDASRLSALMRMPCGTITCSLKLFLLLAPLSTKSLISKEKLLVFAQDHTTRLGLLANNLTTRFSPSSFLKDSVSNFMRTIGMELSSVSLETNPTSPRSALD
jgi:hypothetical protein